MRRLTFLALLGALGACGEGAPDAPVPPITTRPAPPLVAPEASVAGQWRGTWQVCPAPDQCGSIFPIETTIVPWGRYVAMTWFGGNLSGTTNGTHMRVHGGVWRLEGALAAHGTQLVLRGDVAGASALVTLERAQ